MTVIYDGRHDCVRRLPNAGITDGAIWECSCEAWWQYRDRDETWRKLSGLARRRALRRFRKRAAADMAARDPNRRTRR